MICCSISHFVRPAPLMVPAKRNRDVPVIVNLEIPRNLVLSEDDDAELVAGCEPKLCRRTRGGCGRIRVRHPAVNITSANPAIMRKQRRAIIKSISARAEERLSRGQIMAEIVPLRPDRWPRACRDSVSARRPGLRCPEAYMSGTSRLARSVRLSCCYPTTTAKIRPCRCAPWLCRTGNLVPSFRPVVAMERARQSGGRLTTIPKVLFS